MAKGCRSFFVRRKNFERKHCAKADKENRAPTDTVAVLPQHAQCSAETVRALSCKNATSQQACSRGRGVVGDCSRQHPNSELEHIRDSLSSAILPAQWYNFADFTELCKHHGGQITSIPGHVSAYFASERSPTVWHTDCEILCSRSHRCRSCKKYRSTLQSLRCKAAQAKEHCEQHTAHDSHTNHSHLVDSELIQRLQNVQKAKKNYQRSLDWLRAKLNRLIDRDGIKLNTRDSIDMQDLCKDIAGEVRSRFFFH